MEVYFMADKQSFVQIVDLSSGKIEKIVSLSDIESLSAEEKLALARNKNLFVVTHRLEPIVKVEMKKSTINEPMIFGDSVSQPLDEITETPVEEAVSAPKPKGRPKKG